MKEIYKLLIIVILFIGVGCEDFLEKDPPAEVTTSEAILTINDAQVALNGVYSSFKSSSYYTRIYTAVPDILSDEALSVIGYSNQIGEMYKWSFTPGTGEVTNAWAVMYDAIVRASNIINSIDDIEADADEKNRIKGEALLARAIAHFDLVKTYSKTYAAASASDNGVPVILSYELNEPARNTISEVYAQVIDDATDAKALLTNDSPDQVVLTKYASDALLARVYLYMENWDKAAEHATNVIASNNYTLLSGDPFLNMWLNDVGNEIIWKVALTVNDASGRYIGYNYYNDSQGDPKPDYVPAEWLLALYDQGNDIRWNAYYENTTTGYDFNGDGSYWVTTLVNKYPTNPAFTGSNQTGANMPKVFRLAEMYLIRAEAYAELGGANETLAMDDLNFLRAARIGGYVDESLTGAVLKNAIWDERTKELAFEGHRFFDLKRKQMDMERTPQENTVSGPNSLTITSSDHRWLWPIPQDEMNGNTNMIQNLGY